MMNTSLNLSDESVRKRPEINDGTYRYIKNQAEKLNDIGSKSVFVHEIILMTTEDIEEFDDIDKLENRVNDELSDITSPSFVREIEKTKISGKSRSTVTAETTTRLNLQLMPDLVNDVLPDFGRNTVIMDKVDEYFNCAFESRSHRIKVKEDIINYIKNSEKPDTDVAKDIINGESNRYDIDSVSQKLSKYTGDIDVRDITSVDEFRDIVNELKKPRKYDALVNVIKNTNSLNRNQIDKIIREDIGVKTKRYRKQKIDDLLENNDITLSNKIDDDKNIIDEYIEENNLKDAIVRYLNTVDKEYMKEFDVAEQIESITSDKYTEMDVLNNIDEYEGSDLGYIVETDESGIRYLKSPKDN